MTDDEARELATQAWHANRRLDDQFGITLPLEKREAHLKAFVEWYVWLARKANETGE